jgi:cold shock CspA family protein
MLQFEGLVKYDKEDGGQALIATIYEGGPEDMFVRIQSWEEEDQNNPDKEPEHKTAKSLEGKRVRVTIEVID